VWRRWDKDHLFRQLRDKLSFHFDEPVLFDRGIDSICEAHERIVAFDSDCREGFRWRDSLGLHVALRGLAVAEADIRYIADHAIRDLETLSSAIHAVFMDLIKAKRTQ
jgi:hypothetical protein